MGYQWLVFVHLVGVFGFLIAHGVSVMVSLRLRSERDPHKIDALLEMSGRTVLPMNVSLGVLLAGGIAAAFVGHLWHFGWIWAALGTLILLNIVMIAMARPYYQRVRFISRAMSEGTQAVTAEQFDSVLKGGKPHAIMAIGFVGLAFILYLMVQKPTLGLSPGAPKAVASQPGVTRVAESASNSHFSVSSLTAPANARFQIVFENKDSGLPHNVAIYTNSSATSALFKGAQFAGPGTRVYSVPSLAAGTYFFRCDVHPTQMTGTITVS